MNILNKTKEKLLHKKKTQCDPYWKKKITEVSCDPYWKNERKSKQ